MIIDRSKLEWGCWRKGGYVWREQEWMDERGAGSDSYLVIPAWWEDPNFGYVDDCDLPEAPYSYRPMENKTILKSFVNTEPTKEGVMSFVEKFGHLGISEYHQKEGAKPVYGESYSDWISEISQVRGVLANWRLVGSGEALNFGGVGDGLGLRSSSLMAQLSDDEKRFLEPAKDGVVNFDAPFNSEIGRLLEIANAINSKLNVGIEPVAKINESADGISFALAPRRLINAIWLQVAQLVSPTSRFKMCGYCEEIFEAKSLKAQYCRQSHQQMAHRKRKKINDA